MKSIQLILTDPCAERWSNMSEIGQERYCERCEKNIVDLTLKTDAELINFFKEKNEKVCGKLFSTQLNRKLQVPATKSYWHWMIPFVFTAITITPTQAQQLKPVNIEKESNPKSKPSNPAPQLTGPKLFITITIVDSVSDKPLGNVKVRKKNFENVLAISDENGKVKLDIAQTNRTGPFVFELNGNSKIESSLHDGLIIKFESSYTVTLGGISAVPFNRTPLYMVYAGNKSCELDATKFSNLNPAWIESVDVFKGSDKAAIYGAKAINGVVIIRIKKEHYNKFVFNKNKQ